ncbi:hypothetical protein NQ011_01215 [Corynebacterium phoceense]|nr:hypothetical protein [Corynebacterium phoceense]MCQ9335335.1 hypothetical protein [Corynebacterium phoceense]
MRIPSYQAILGAIIWSVGVLVFGIVALLHSPKLGLVVVITDVFGGAIVALMTYLIAERLVRPVAAEALARRAPDSSLEPPSVNACCRTGCSPLACPWGPYC